MLFPIERVWKTKEPEVVIQQEPVQLEEQPKPEKKMSIKIPLPTLPHPDTIHSVCLVLMVVLLFLLLLEMKQMVRLLSK